MDLLYILLSVYLIVVNVNAVYVTIKDKSAAKKQKRRVPEKTLFGFSLLGGGVSMYITMQLIRHKTQHKRFMIGIPVIIVLQVALVIICMIYGDNLWLS